VAAWTSDIKPRWSADWMRWPAFPKFWAQVVRSTMRRRAATHLPLVAALSGDNLTITIDAVGDDDQFLSGLQGTVAMVTAAASADANVNTSPTATASSRKLPLIETAPGRYEAHAGLAAPAGGALLLTAELRRGTLPVAEASGRLALTYARELRPRIEAARALDDRTDGTRLLEALAARTGGTILDDPARVLDPGADHRTAQVPVRTEILLGTVGLFLLDVLIRRVRLPIRKKQGH
jgi:hypothetical protein